MIWAFAGTALKAVCGFIFDNSLGKLVSAGALVIGSFMLWLWTHDAKVSAEAQHQVVTEINTQSEQLTNAGLTAREAANKVGAWGRLREHHCRDCN